MCYLVVERYSIFRCLYYQHSVDICAAYRQQGHRIAERTVLVGYTCERHAPDDGDYASLWSSIPNPSGDQPAQKVPQGVQITSAVALGALKAANVEENYDEDATTEKGSGSASHFTSTQATLEDHQSYQWQGGEPKRISSHAANLEDLYSRLRHPGHYITSLQELEQKVWDNSIISMYTTWNMDDAPSVMHQRSYAIYEYISYPAVPADLQDLIPNRLSEDPFPKDPTNTSDAEITALCQPTGTSRGSAALNATTYSAVPKRDLANLP